jgi:hypothetical protein
MAIHLIDKDEIFQQKVDEVGTFVSVKTQLPQQVFQKQFSNFVVIDFDEIYSEFFFQNLQRFLKQENGHKWTFAVLENDPKEFFFKHCKKYPFFEVTADDSYEEYLSIARDELECLPNESLADNAYIFVVYSDSLEWAIYADFNFEIGIAGFLSDEIRDKFISNYGKQRIFTMKEAITELLSVIYRDNIVPEEISNELLINYGQ